MRVVILRGRVSIGHFLLGGVLIFEGCSEDYLYLFLFSILDTLFLLYIGLMAIWYTLNLYLVYIYILMYVISPISLCVVSFLSLYTCFLFIICNLLFLFHTKMPWWVLFKLFQKYRLLKSTCHKLSSCKVFQEFVLG